MVVASAVDKEGEEIYPAKWNHEFMDMPMVEKTKQNTPCFSAGGHVGLGKLEEATRADVVHLCGAPA